MKTKMSEIAVGFARLLDRRLDANVRTTEDSIRYTLFAALLCSGIPPERIVLEDEHPQIERAKIDMVILNADASCEVAIEFKYDRANPGGTGQPMTQKAGMIFGDLSRLLKLPLVATRYFVYVTDEGLARYLASPRNGFAAFFNLSTGSELRLDKAFFAGRSRTFLESMDRWPMPATVKSVINRGLPRNHHLRIYEIRNVPTGEPSVSRKLPSCREGQKTEAYKS